MSHYSGEGTVVDKVLNAVDAREVIDLTRRLVQMASENPPAHEEAVARVVANEARRLGMVATLEYVASGRPNVTIGAQDDGTNSAVATLYCGHLDTVPCGDASLWEHPPLGGELSEGRIWGRGSVDMKGGLAAMVCGLAALHTVIPEVAQSVRVVAFIGEEVDCAGSRYFVRAGKFGSVKSLVVGEPTGLMLGIAQKGAVRLRVTVRGQAAHGSRPELGINAIVHMARIIDAMVCLRFVAATHRLLTPTTLSINTIRGGIAGNVVPDLCSIEVDVRTLPGQDQDEVVREVEGCVRGVVSAHPGLEGAVEVVDMFAATETDEQSGLLRGAQKALSAVGVTRKGVVGVSYYSDASVLRTAIPAAVMLFGPGEIEGMHQVNESVAVRDVVQAAQFFAVLPLLV